MIRLGAGVERHIIRGDVGMLQRAQREQRLLRQIVEDRFGVPTMIAPLRRRIQIAGEIHRRIRGSGAIGRVNRPGIRGVPAKRTRHQSLLGQADIGSPQIQIHIRADRLFSGPRVRQVEVEGRDDPAGGSAGRAGGAVLGHVGSELARPGVEIQPAEPLHRLTGGILNEHHHRRVAIAFIELVVDGTRGGCRSGIGIRVPGRWPGHIVIANREVRRAPDAQIDGRGGGIRCQGGAGRQRKDPGFSRRDRGGWQGKGQIPIEFVLAVAADRRVFVGQQAHVAIPFI